MNSAPNRYSESITPLASLLFFCTNACVLAVLEDTLRDDVTKEPHAPRQQQHPRKIKTAATSLQPTLQSIRDLCRYLQRLGMCLGISWLCEHHPSSPHSAKIMNRDLHWFLCIVAVVFSLFGIRRSTSSDTILNREQSDEWKGWMQMFLLLYHYFQSDDMHNSMRVLITCYVWMTGFGHFSYFYTTNDFSLPRVLQVLWRINFLGLMLCMVMGNSYILYYACPLHSVSFLTVYATMRIAPEWNHTKWGIRVKLLAVAGIVFAVWDLPRRLCLFRFIFGWMSSDPIRGADQGVLREWYFRTSLDHYGTLLGMGFALNYPMMTLLFSKVDEGQSARLITKVLVKVSFALVIGVAMASWVAFFARLPVSEYNTSNPYLAMLPLLTYLLLRNISAHVRGYYLWGFQTLGRMSLETALLHHHVWLASNGGSVLTIIPRYPMLNVLVTSGLLLVMAREVHHVTSCLRELLLPDDASHCLRSVTAIASLAAGLCVVSALMKDEQQSLPQHATLDYTSSYDDNDSSNGTDSISSSNHTIMIVLMVAMLSLGALLYARRLVNNQPSKLGSRAQHGIRWRSFPIAVCVIAGALHVFEMYTAHQYTVSPSGSIPPHPDTGQTDMTSAAAAVHKLGINPKVLARACMSASNLGDWHAPSSGPGSHCPVGPHVVACHADVWTWHPTPPHGPASRCHPVS